jgi:hypothetical protein
VIIPGEATETIECSRASCREKPFWQVIWRNPKIHAADRKKIWLACDEHRVYFESYLSQKGFPVGSIPLEPESD